jgi:agmatine deiminase
MSDPEQPRLPFPDPPRLQLGRRRFLAALGLGTVSGAVALTGHRLPEPRPAAAVRPTHGSRFSVPLDTRRHRRTWMAWPDSSAIWGNQLHGVQGNIALIATTIAEHEPVVMLANPRSVAEANHACRGMVNVIGRIPVDDCWMRDMGPVFRTNGVGDLDAIGLNFNGWGGKQTHAKDALVARRVAGFLGIPFTAAGFVGEGGAIETDGDGTLMATRSSLDNPNRNPGTTPDRLAAAMCIAYGAEKVIWFTGVRGQDITDDHVDGTSRFLGDATSVVQWPHPGDTDAFSRDARDEYRILSGSTDAHRRPMTVTKLQGPDYNKIRSTNPAFVGAYVNYYVCNGAVIASQFGDTETDAAARATLARLLPGRVVKQLNTDFVGAGGGGIHCVTQQEPLP